MGERLFKARGLQEQLASANGEGALEDGTVEGGLHNGLALRGLMVLVGGGEGTTLIRLRDGNEFPVADA